MPFPSFSLSFSSLAPDLAALLQKFLATLVEGFLAVEHNDDGTHKFAYVNRTLATTNFTGSSAMTLTVGRTDVVTDRYLKRGDAMKVEWYLAAGTLAGTPSTKVQIVIPESYRAVAKVLGVCRISNGGVDSLAPCVVEANSTTIDIYADATLGTNWTAGAMATQGHFEFGVQK